MEIQQLVYFKETAKLQSISKAAAKLSISQPSLSSSIIRLENELGVKLFDRVGRNVRLNENGIFFLSKVETVLNAVASSKAAFHSESISGSISIVSRNYYTGIFGIIADFREKHPKVSFDIYRCSNYESFQVKDYDFVIHNQNIVLPAAMNRLFIAKRTYGVMLPVSHPLSRESSISLEQLKDERFVFKRDPNGDLEMPHQMCIESGFLPDVAVSTNSDAYKIDVMRSHVAVGIVTNEWLSAFNQSDLSFVPLTGFDGYTNTMISWSDKVMVSPLTSAFADFLMDRFS